MIKTLIIGVAMSSVWFWIFALLRGFNTAIFKWWLKIIVPQGIIIAFALLFLGVIK